MASLFDIYSSLMLSCFGEQMVEQYYDLINLFCMILVFWTLKGILSWFGLIGRKVFSRWF